MDAPTGYASETRPTTSEEVATAVRAAVADSRPISIRSGGHSEPYFPNPGGALIDLAAFDTIEVRKGGIVDIGGGQTWGVVARELGTHKLALTSGDTESVGVGGLTLGGGIGWMVRQYGLALDSLIGAEVVTAAGDVVTASATENADLFWALRGGGGNFGVVTRFTFQAHPLDGVVFAKIAFDGDHLADVLRGLRDTMRSADERLTVTVLMTPGFGPDMPPNNAINACWGGSDEADAAAAFAPLLALPGVLSSQIEPSAYADVLEPSPPEGDPNAPAPVMVDHNAFVDDLDDAAIDSIVALQRGLGAAVLLVRTVGGAFARVAPDATAFAYRSGEVFLMAAAFLPPGSDSDRIDAIHAIWAQFEPHATGLYGNFSPTTGESITERMYPPATLERLREVKRAYDPSNVFAHNHNVRP
jgi:FAD/FMN-containing dehydrogenase